MHVVDSVVELDVEVVAAVLALADVLDCVELVATLAVKVKDSLELDFEAVVEVDWLDEVGDR